MILYADSKEADNIVVFLDDKPVKHYLSAKDGAQGWIEIIDPAAMAPLNSNEGDPWSELEDEEEADLDWAPIKTRKISGKVEFRRPG